MVQLLNPAGSTVKLIVYNASASSSGVGFVHTAPYGVPLANLASTLYNKDFGYSGSPAFAEVRWGFSGALLGLAGPSRYVLARTEAPVFPGGEIHLSPGTGLLLGSGVVASTLLAAFEWREVPV